MKLWVTLIVLTTTPFTLNNCCIFIDYTTSITLQANKITCPHLIAVWTPLPLQWEDEADPRGNQCALRCSRCGNSWPLGGEWEGEKTVRDDSCTLLSSQSEPTSACEWEGKVTPEGDSCFLSYSQSGHRQPLGGKAKTATRGNYLFYLVLFQRFLCWFLYVSCNFIYCPL